MKEAFAKFGDCVDIFGKRGIELSVGLLIVGDFECFVLAVTDGLEFME